MSGRSEFKDFKEECSVESAILGDPKEYALDSDDSVYDLSYQSIDVKEHAMLRSYRLKKVIRKDKNISKSERKNYKIRRNIILHRLRKTEAKMKLDLVVELEQT